MNRLTQSWLDQQCSMLDGVSSAVMLMRSGNNHEYTPVASWPAAGNTPAALLATARAAIASQDEVIHRTGQQEPPTAAPVETIACPVMMDNHMRGVVVIRLGLRGSMSARGILEQLRCGCSWLSMLLRRESESGKHYLATMLEMAAMFVENLQEPADDHTAPVITRIIDTLNEHLGTDTSTLLQQIRDTVQDARGAGRTNLARQVSGMPDDGTGLDIARALDEDRFLLHYQPKIDLRTGCIACMEALLRLDHPDSGLHSPESFLPAATQSGLMPAIDDWVLRTACRQLQTWHMAGYDRLSIAVNLSAEGFTQPQLARRLVNLTGELGISAQRLEIEVTEHALMNNLDIAASVIRSLHDARIRVSVDDFGTGYSSLNYLQRLPISGIKIDRSFIGDITSDKDIATIVRGIITMAHATGLEVIAEGVETGAQLAFLRKLKCDQFQGYFFSGPLEPDAALQLLEMETTAGSLLDYADRVS